MARIKRIATELQVKDKLLDYSGDAGTSGQLLSSTGTGTNWITFSGVTASNGANTRVAFFTGSTTIEGSTGLYWNNSDNRLGIGTSSPAYTLDVAGTIRVGSGGSIQPLLSRDSATGGLIVSSVNNSGDFIFKGSGGNEKFRITDSGNVGIGVTSPGVPLDVTGIIRTTTSFVGNASIVNQVTAATSGGHIKFKNNDGVDRAIITDSGSLAIGTNSPENKLEVVGDLRIRNANGSNPTDAGSLIFAETGGTWGTNLYGFRINQVGDNNYLNFQSANTTTVKDILTLTRDTARVGIGTTSPLATLTVGSGTGSLNTSAELFVPNNDALMRTLKIGHGSSVATIITDDSTKPMVFNTGGSERMRILSDGKVGIGTTSPGKKLTVNGQTQFYEYSGAHLTHDATSNYNFDTLVNHADATDGGGLQAYIKLTSGATNSSLGQFNAIRTRAYAENTTNNVGGLINFYAEHRNFTSTSSVTLGNHYGLKVNTLGVGGNATVTNNYGVYLNPGTAATNNYGVFQAGGSVKNKFEGPVGINTNPAAGVELHVNGEIRVDSTSGVATRMIRSSYFSSSSDIEVRSGSSGDIILGDGTARLTLASDDTATFAGDVTVTGNLTVDGTTTTINTATVEVEDNILQLNTTQGSPDTATATTSGISVYRGDGVTQASFIFDDADDTWDLTNNLAVADKIGINKSSPSGRLHINQTADNQGIIIESGSVQPEIEFRDTATGDTFSIGHNRSASQLAIEVDGTDKYVFTDGGRLGIGTTSPGAALSAVTAETTVGIFKSTTDQTIIKIEDHDTIGYIGVKDNDIAIGGNSSMSADANFKIDVTTGTAAFGLSPSANDKFRLRQTFNTSNDTSNNGLFIDYNASGTDALTSDKNAIALRVDMDSTATGGNQTQELTMYAGYFDVTDDGDANHLYGMYAQAIARKTAANDTQSTVHAYKGLARAGHTAGQVNQIVGGEFIAQTDNNGGTVNDLVGVKGLIQNTGDAGQDVANSRAGLFKVDISGSSNDPIYTNVYGIDSEIEMDETTTIGSAFVNFSRIDANEGTITSAYLYRGTYNVHSNATVTNKYGIYLDGCERSYIQGSINLGGTGNYNAGVPLAVKATAENTAEVLTKIWDGSNWAFSIDRSSTNTDANTELYRLGLNYNNGGAANGYIGFFRGSSGGNGFLTLGTSDTERMRIDTSGNITMTGKINAKGGAGVTGFHAATINAYTATVSSNLYSALRIVDNTAASTYWDIGAVGGASPDLKFFVNAATTPKLTLSATGNATFTGNITLSSNSTVVAARKFVARDGNGVMLTADDAVSGLSIADNGNATFTGNVYIDGDDIYLGDEETRIKTYSTYLGIFAAGGSAKDVKAKSLTLTSDFNDSAPAHGLYVKGDASFGGDILPSANVSKNLGSTSNYFLNVNAYVLRSGGVLQFKTNGDNERMRIDASGNVGLGTTSPGTNLDIQGTAAQSLRVKSDSSASIIIDSDGDDDGTAGSYLHYRDTGATKWTLYKETNNDFYLHNAAASTYPIHAQAGGNILLMEDGNNLGIGAGTPAAKLDVNAGTENFVANFTSTDSIAEIRIEDSSKYTRLLTVGTQFKIMPNDGSETLILDGNNDSATFAGDVLLGDNQKAKFGDNPDLQIYHNGSHSFIQDIGAGDLRLLGSVVKIQNSSETDWITCSGNIVQLRNAGNVKLATTGGGVDITGALAVGGINMTGVLDISAAYPRINLNDTNHEDDWSIINDDGSFKIYNVDDAVDSLKIDASNNTTFAGNLTIPEYIYHSGDTNTFFKFNSGGWEIQSSGGPTTDISATGGVTSIFGKGQVAISCGTGQVSTFSGNISPGTNKVLDRDIPCLFNSNLQDLSGTTRRFVPFNSTTVNAASSPTVVNYLVMPYAGRVKKVYFKRVAGSSGTGFNITMYIYKNGANVANSGGIAWPSSHQAAWSPTSNNTFAAGDTIAIAFQKTTSGVTLGHVSVGLAVELTDYDI